MNTVFSTIQDFNQAFSSSLSFTPTLSVTDNKLLRDGAIDLIVYNALFSPSDDVREHAQTLIYQLSELLYAHPCSLFSMYQAFGTNELRGFTTPALNVRMLTYDIARSVFRLMNTKKIGAVIFEISRTEMIYTDQSPKQYAVCVLAAAIKEGYEGPVFLQGDHFQFDKIAFAENQEKEVSQLKALISQTITAKFYNIDIDASTLVDLMQPSVVDQQRLNAQMTAHLSEYIRKIQPPEEKISIGAEIGHIGDKNSTSDDLHAFLELYQQLQTNDGISKVSVQTGSSHGGTLLPDGTLKKVVIDFSVLREISMIAKRDYHFGGSVQHGASTLPDSDFDKFAENETLEIHLATGIQNIAYKNLPPEITKELSDWTLKQREGNFLDETQEQYVYKTRKKALGPFKKLLWDMSEDDKLKVSKAVEDHLLFIFEKLRIFETRDKILPYYVK